MGRQVGSQSTVNLFRSCGFTGKGNNDDTPSELPRIKACRRIQRLLPGGARPRANIRTTSSAGLTLICLKSQGGCASSEGWGGRRDSNPQQQAPQAWTLPLSYDHQPADKLGLLTASVKFVTMWVVVSLEFPPFENPFRSVFSTILASSGAYEA